MAPAAFTFVDSLKDRLLALVRGLSPRHRAEFFVSAGGDVCASCGEDNLAIDDEVEAGFTTPATAADVEGEPLPIDGEPG